MHCTLEHHRKQGSNIISASASASLTITRRNRMYYLQEKCRSVNNSIKTAWLALCYVHFWECAGCYHLHSPHITPAGTVALQCRFCVLTSLILFSSNMLTLLTLKTHIFSKCIVLLFPVVHVLTKFLVKLHSKDRV